MLSLGPSGKFVRFSYQDIGFHKTPFTKALLISTAVTSFAASVFEYHPYVHLILYPAISPNLQLWRLITSNFILTSSSEMLFGMLLLYQCRILERMWGTKKFASFSVISMGLSTGFQLLLLMVLSKFGVKRTAGGPYAFIFATMVQLIADIPVTFKVTAANVQFSDKMMLYLLCLQMSFCAWPYSVYSTGSGILAGLIYRLTGVKRWRLSPSIVGWFDRNVGTWIPSNPNVSRPRSTFYERTSTSIDSLINDASRASAASSPIPGPSEDQIVQLTSMGFSRTDAIRALERTNNNVPAAVAYLLD